MAKKWTVKLDDAYDKKHGIKEGSKKDIALDKRRGIYATEMKQKNKKGVKKYGKKS